MKGLPEKVVLSAIILSCGFVATSDPTAHGRPVKRETVASLHTWQALPSAASVAQAPRAAKTLAARGEIP